MVGSSGGGLGLLRLWFALIVVFEHGNPTHPKFPIIDSDGAVLGFFVLSGFYMAMILETRYRDDLKSFYFNRFLRLYPTYLVCLLSSVAVLTYLSVARHQPYGPLEALAEVRPSSWTWFWSALSQLSMWGQDFSTYAFVGQEGGLHFALRSASHGGESFFNYNFIPQAWTLSIELTFYAIVPFVNWWRSRVLVALFLGGLLVRVAAMAALPADDHLWFNRIFPLELSVFCGGIVAWRFVQSMPRRLRGWLDRLTLLGVGSLLLLGWLWDSTSAHCVTVPLLVALALPCLWSNWNSDLLDRFLGELSYPVYTCHILICYMLLAALPQDQRPLLPVYAIVGSLGAAAILRFGLERPLEHFKKNPTGRIRER